MPRDYIRRRRVCNRVTNALLITTLSIGAAWIITRQPETPSFLPKTNGRSGVSTAPQANVAQTAAAYKSKEYNSNTRPVPVVEVQDLALRDAGRNRDVHVRILYPKIGGRYPLIIFSQDMNSPQSCCDALTRHWASSGYITILPTHDDSVIQDRNSKLEKVRFSQRQGPKSSSQWESRPLDISFIIDSLPEIQKRVPGLDGKIDKVHIGVGGHATASYAAEVIAGALVDLPGRPQTTLADPRVRAILCLSPQGPGQFGLAEHSFDQLVLPYLGVTGSLDNSEPIASAAWRKMPFDRSQPGDKYEVFIQGATHKSFVQPQSAGSDNSNSLGPGNSVLEYTDAAALAFWDAYLKHDTAAKIYLQSGALEKSSQGAVKIDRR